MFATGIITGIAVADVIARIATVAVANGIAGITAFGITTSAECEAFEEFLQRETTAAMRFVARIAQAIARTAGIRFIARTDITASAGEQPFEAFSEGKLEAAICIATQVSTVTARITSDFVARRTGDYTVARTTLPFCTTRAE